jgi:SAM-dependent methyltransferase
MKICLVCGQLYADASWHCPSCGEDPPVLGGFPAFAPQYAHEGQGFRPEYFKILATLEADNFWFRARNRLIIDSLRRYFPGLQDFLEVGCGTGYVLSGVSSAFPGARLAGTEIFCIGLDFASRRVPKAEFLQVDARRIPYSAEFDVVGAFDVLEHIPEDEAVISQIHQAIKPGGGIVVTVPQHDWLWSRQDELAGHVRRYSAKELRGKVTRAGFRVIKICSFVSLLLPALWLSRLIGNSREADPLSELRLGGFVNTLLGGVMTTEYALKRFGVSFPWGGSLLLIARKE